MAKQVKVSVEIDGHKTLIFHMEDGKETVIESSPKSCDEQNMAHHAIVDVGYDIAKRKIELDFPRWNNSKEIVRVL